MEEKQFSLSGCKRWFSQKKADKKTILILLLGVGGMLLIFLSGLQSSDGEISSSAAEEVFNTEAYTQLLEKRITGILETSQGISDVQVMLTLESGKVYYYQTETQSSGSQQRDENSSQTTAQTQETYLLADDAPVLYRICEPEVRGVMIVCKGADDAAVRRDITQAVATLLDIPLGRVYILSGGE